MPSGSARCQVRRAHLRPATHHAVGPEVHDSFDGAGDALEFTIGTGRVTLPVTIGDVATTRLDRDFGLVFLVFDTIQNLLPQDEQIACFANAAAHLRSGGRFVVEAGVPGIRRLPPGERFVAFDATAGHIGVDEYEPALQLLTSHHVWPRSGTAFASQHRYVWPSELGLMARLAGLTLEHRWSDWDRSAFTDDSDRPRERVAGSRVTPFDATRSR